MTGQRPIDCGLPRSLLMVAPLLAIAFAPSDEVIASERNFFGVLQVLRDQQGVRLVHGTTIHGMQFIGENAQEPTSYYCYAQRYREGDQVAAGQSPEYANRRHRAWLWRAGHLRARRQIEFDMIEINPAVVEIANTHFSFLRDSPCDHSHAPW